MLFLNFQRSEHEFEEETESQTKMNLDEMEEEMDDKAYDEHSVNEKGRTALVTIGHARRVGSH